MATSTNLPTNLRAYGNVLAQIGQTEGATILHAAADEIERLQSIELAYGEMLRDEKLKDDALRFTQRPERADEAAP